MAAPTPETAVPVMDGTGGGVVGTCRGETGTDGPLDRAGADRNVPLQDAVPSASLVAAAVALAAERLAAGDVVEALTSDVPDLEALAGHLSVDVEVRLV